MHDRRPVVLEITACLLNGIWILLIFPPCRKRGIYAVLLLHVVHHVHQKNNFTLYFRNRSANFLGLINTSIEAIILPFWYYLIY
jgi:hypothetical protein